MNNTGSIKTANGGQPEEPSVFGRAVELAELRRRFSDGRSFLLHGPIGVGKTLLLCTVADEYPLALYSAVTGTPQELYRNLAYSLLEHGDESMRSACPQGMASVTKRSLVALRGIVRDVLRGSSYLVILDHLQRPSQSLAASARELMVECSVAVIAVSRSSHMEDVGFVLSLFSDRSEKLLLRNFDSQTAGCFASWCAKREELTAKNLSQFLEKVAEQSEGNPGAITRMIRMAKLPRYLSRGQIKSVPLYIDFKIASVSQ